MGLKLTQGEIEERLKLYREGKTFKEIAGILHYEERSLKAWYRRQGIKTAISFDRKAGVEKANRMRSDIKTLEEFIQVAGTEPGPVYDRVAKVYGIARSIAYDYWRVLKSRIQEGK